MLVSLIQGYQPGCIGQISQLHGAYYAARHGFGVAFEAKVARGLADFCERMHPQRDGLWLACQNGQIQASVAIDGSHADSDGAHLRWFIVSDALRGQGVGRQLLSQALSFADECGYAKTYLWTFAGLDAARHLYEAHGFKLAYQDTGTQWGTAVTEQRFERLLGR